MTFEEKLELEFRIARESDKFDKLRKVTKAQWMQDHVPELGDLSGPALRSRIAKAKRAVREARNSMYDPEKD